MTVVIHVQFAFSINILHPCQKPFQIIISSTIRSSTLSGNINPDAFNVVFSLKVQNPSNDTRQKLIKTWKNVANVFGNRENMFHKMMITTFTASPT